VDPLGALAALTAVALYPGGLFVAALAVALRWSSGSSPGRRVGSGDLIAMLAATVAASLAPAPGSVATLLPPSPAFGVEPNLGAAIVLEALAVSLAGGGPWNVTRLALSVTSLAPLLVLAALAATLSLPVLAGMPGALVSAGRALAAGALLTAGLVASPLRGEDDAARLFTLASLAVLAGSLALSASTTQLPAPAAAAALGGVALAYGLVARVLRGTPSRATVAALVLAQTGAALGFIVTAHM
jgi:hypothetical protein